MKKITTLFIVALTVSLTSCSMYVSHPLDDSFGVDPKGVQKSISDYRSIPATDKDYHY